MSTADDIAEYWMMALEEFNDDGSVFDTEEDIMTRKWATVYSDTPTVDNKYKVAIAKFKANGDAYQYATTLANRCKDKIITLVDTGNIIWHFNND